MLVSKQTKCCELKILDDKQTVFHCAVLNGQLHRMCSDAIFFNFSVGFLPLPNQHIGTQIFMLCAVFFLDHAPKIFAAFGDYTDRNCHIDKPHTAVFACHKLHVVTANRVGLTVVVTNNRAVIQRIDATLESLFRDNAAVSINAGVCNTQHTSIERRVNLAKRGERGGICHMNDFTHCTHLHINKNPTWLTMRVRMLACLSE